MLPQEGPGALGGYPLNVPAAPSPCLLLSAPPGAPGVEALLERATAYGAPLRVLLSAGGLKWADQARLRALGDVAVCSQNAREAGWTLESTPAGVRWSSVATWLAELDPGAPLWVALP